MGYINYQGTISSYNSFFNDDILDRVVNFEDDNDYLITDVFDYEGVTFIGMEDEAGNSYFLSQEFFICERLSDYFDDDKELDKLYPSCVRNPYDGYEDYLYEMQRDKELLGW